MPLPCDCCPTGGPQCATVAVQFTSAAETASQAGWTPVAIDATADGVTSTTALSGYTTVAGNTPSTTLRVTYTHSSPQSRVRGLRLWNQCGSDLGDADGLGHFDAAFYAGATLLTTLHCIGGNGGAPFTFPLPAGVELNGVTSVVLRNLSKQVGGTAAPLWRELQLLEYQTVFPCRRRNGTLEWYDEAGNLVPTADIEFCEPHEPFILPDLRLVGAAFGDDPGGIGENLCNVSPAPASFTGWTVNGACYDPTVGSPTMNWAPLSSVVMEYDEPAAGTSGGVFVQFSSPSLGNITWPANNTDMAVGTSRMSNPFGGGRRAVLTYLSGPAAGSASGTIRMPGGINVSVHPANVSNQAPIRFRLDFVTA